MEQILKERGQFDLNIGFFEDLFNADELSCIDQPIAACAGIYDLDYTICIVFISYTSPIGVIHYMVRF